MAVSVKVIDNFIPYGVRSIAAATIATRRMAADIHNLSKTQVPYDTGALSKSGQLRQQGSNFIISYSTPYSRRWHFESANFKHGRKRFYLSDPAKMVAAQAPSYYRGALG